MSLWIIVALVVLPGVTGRPNVTDSPDADAEDTLAHPNSLPEFIEEEMLILGQVRGKQTQFFLYVSFLFFYSAFDLCLKSNEMGFFKN